MLYSQRNFILILSLIACLCSSLGPLFAEERAYQEGQGETFSSLRKHDHRTYGSPSDGEIYLEGVEDLDHLSYLSLRNYNLTDEGLLKTIRLSGLGTVLGPHKLHQIDETASVLLKSADRKTRLPLLLESFISHLRNGRLKRMSLTDIEATTSALNLTDAYLKLQRKRLHTLGVTQNSSIESDSPNSQPSSDEIRCIHLVTQYKFDLMNELQRLQSQQQQQQRSKVEYENSQAINGSHSQDGKNNLNQGQNGSSIELANGTAREVVVEVQNEHIAMNIDLDETRLIRLCKLAIVCRSADELISLISKPWRDQASKDLSEDRSSQDRSQLERDSSLDSYGSITGGELNLVGEMMPQPSNSPESGAKSGSLRDSLSLSLAKLCPMILFPLHENEGQCSLRRDDRPPMITVWGFATLFVTIVCFCSLIGLSITPLLGQSATESTTSSDINEPLTNFINDLPHDPTALKRDVTRKKHEHKASLTLFEGLAVGSLVGSALFSLIPQAFELQERESNQTFLLKAFIIFSGIYLFFCSERIMRIILDTRQMRKKRKQSLHRSSTTAPVDGVIVDGHCKPQLQQSCSREHPGSRRAESSQPLSASQISSARPTESEKGKTDKKSKKLRTEVPRESPTLDPPSKKVKAQKSYQQHRQLDAKVQSDRRRHEHYPTSTTRQVVQKPNSQRRQRTKRSSRWSKRQISSRIQAQNRQSQKHNSERIQKESGQHQARQKQGHGGSAKIKRTGRVSSKKRQLERSAMAESDIDDNLSQRNSSSTASTSSSTSSFSSYTMNRLRETQGGLVARVKHNEDSQVDYSFSSSSSSSASASSSSKCSDCTPCSSCASFEHEYQYDSDDNQARAVNKRMREFSRQLAEEYSGHAVQRPNDDPVMSSSLPQLRTKFKCGEGDDDQEIVPVLQDRTNSRLTHSSEHQSQRSSKQDISTVAWMIVLGDGLHNFIDGISIGAAFSESILSGVSISVAVICEEFPHELGDFAVLVSAGMTVRQALGYNFLSACTCYVGMAVGIILGDVTDGASYISALAAGVFLYIALVDMMGELSAALEESSRASIGRTLKLLLLQHIGIFIGISIIFVLSFIDF